MSWSHTNDKSLISLNIYNFYIKIKQFEMLIFYIPTGIYQHNFI